MNLETKVLPMATTPIDLMADTDIAAAQAAAGAEFALALQNVTSGRLIYYALRADAPDDGSRNGLLLRYGDLVILADIEDGDKIWCWTTSASASLAVAEA